MGLFSSKKSVTENKQYTTNNVSQPVFSGDNHGINLQGEGNSLVMADPGLVSSIDKVTAALNGGIERSLSSVDNSVLGNQQIVELSLMNGLEQSAITNEALQAANGNMLAISQDSMFNTVTMAQDALEFGRDGLDFGRDAMGSNERLASQFGSDLAYLTDATLGANQSLAAQFGQDLKGAFDGVTALASDFGFNLTTVTSDALASNERLSDSFNSRLSGVVSDSLSFADQQNYYLAETLNNQSSLVADTLKEMAVLQEKGLDNALTVAGNISMDDAAESSRDIMKYLSIAAAVVGVAMVLRA